MNRPVFFAFVFLQTVKSIHFVTQKKHIFHKPLMFRVDMPMRALEQTALQQMLNLSAKVASKS